MKRSRSPATPTGESEKIGRGGEGFGPTQAQLASLEHTLGFFSSSDSSSNESNDNDDDRLNDVTSEREESAEEEKPQHVEGGRVYLTRAEDMQRIAGLHSNLSRYAALHLAVKRGHEDIVRLMIGRIETGDGLGWDPSATFEALAVINHFSDHFKSKARAVAKQRQQSRTQGVSAGARGGGEGGEGLRAVVPAVAPVVSIALPMTREAVSRLGADGAVIPPAALHKAFRERFRNLAVFTAEKIGVGVAVDNCDKAAFFITSINALHRACNHGQLAISKYLILGTGKKGEIEEERGGANEANKKASWCVDVSKSTQVCLAVENGLEPCLQYPLHFALFHLGRLLEYAAYLVAPLAASTTNTNRYDNLRALLDLPHSNRCVCAKDIRKALKARLRECVDLVKFLVSQGAGINSELSIFRTFSEVKYFSKNTPKPSLTSVALPLDTLVMASFFSVQFSLPPHSHIPFFFPRRDSDDGFERGRVAARQISFSSVNQIFKHIGFKIILPLIEFMKLQGARHMHPSTSVQQLALSFVGGHFVDRHVFNLMPSDRQKLYALHARFGFDIFRLLDDIIKNGSKKAAEASAFSVVASGIHVAPEAPGFVGEDLYDPFASLFNVRILSGELRQYFFEILRAHDGRNPAAFNEFLRRGGHTFDVLIPFFIRSSSEFSGSNLGGKDISQLEALFSVGADPNPTIRSQTLQIRRHALNFHGQAKSFRENVQAFGIESHSMQQRNLTKADAMSVSKEGKAFFYPCYLRAPHTSVMFSHEFSKDHWHLYLHDAIAHCAGPSSRGFKVAELLLEAGADPNKRDSYGRPPMHTACCPAAVFLLVEFGAKPDARDALGNSALHNLFCPEIPPEYMLSPAETFEYRTNRTARGFQHNFASRVASDPYPFIHALGTLPKSSPVTFSITLANALVAVGCKLNGTNLRSATPLMELINAHDSSRSFPIALFKVSPPTAQRVFDEFLQNLTLTEEEAGKRLQCTNDGDNKEVAQRFSSVREQINLNLSKTNATKAFTLDLAHADSNGMTALHLALLHFDRADLGALSCLASIATCLEERRGDCSAVVPFIAEGSAGSLFVKCTTAPLYVRKISGAMSEVQYASSGGGRLYVGENIAPLSQERLTQQEVSDCDSENNNAHGWQLLPSGSTALALANVLGNANAASIISRYRYTLTIKPNLKRALTREYSPRTSQ